MTILQGLLSGVSHGILKGVLGGEAFISLVNNGQLSPLFTFTRASSQTYIDSDGLLKEVGTDVPAIDYSQGFAALSLWVEGSTNLVRYSEQLDNVIWEAATGGNEATVTANDAESPDGETTADRLTDDNTGATLERQAGAIAISASNNYCLSFFLKKQTGTPIFNCNLKFRNGTAKNIQLKIDASNGNILQHGDADVRSGIDYEVNGYYRVYIVGNSGNNTGAFLNLKPAYTDALANAENVSITGFNHVWGVQFENKSYPTPYIPTVASTASRAAPSVSITGTNFNFFNAKEGTFLLDYIMPYELLSSARLVAINNGGGSERILLFESNSTSNISYIVTDGGVTQAFLDAGVASEGARKKTAFKYKADDFALSATGGTLQTDTTGTLPTVDRLFLGQDVGGTNPNNILVNSLRYYPKGLTNAKMENLVA